TTQRTFHQLHSKPTLPGSAFFMRGGFEVHKLRAETHARGRGSDHAAGNYPPTAVGWCDANWTLVQLAPTRHAVHVVVLRTIHSCPAAGVRRMRAPGRRAGGARRR